MNTSDSSSHFITRRDFMKKSALTVGAITLLSQGIGLATGSGSSGSSGGTKKTVVSKATYNVSINGQVHTGPPPTKQNYQNYSEYVTDKDAAEESWPDNHNPTNDNHAALFDNDYIEVDSSAELASESCKTDPSIDDTAPEIMAAGENKWYFAWNFKSIITFTYK